MLQDLAKICSYPIPYFSPAVRVFWRLAVGVLLSSFPLVVNLRWTRQRCGPNQGNSLQGSLTKAIGTAPMCGPFRLLCISREHAMCAGVSSCQHWYCALAIHTDITIRFYHQVTAVCNWLQTSRSNWQLNYLSWVYQCIDVCSRSSFKSRRQFPDQTAWTCCSPDVALLYAGNQQIQMCLKLEALNVGGWGHC